MTTAENLAFLKEFVANLISTFQGLLSAEQSNRSVISELQAQLSAQAEQLAAKDAALAAEEAEDQATDQTIADLRDQLMQLQDQISTMISSPNPAPEPEAPAGEVVDPSQPSGAEGEVTPTESATEPAPDQTIL